MKEAFSLRRNSTAAATSSGVPMRRDGVSLPQDFAKSANSDLVRSVSMAPGATQLTRMPNGPSSSAADFVNISIAPLLAVYEERFGNGTLLQPEPILTMAPERRSCM